MGSDAAINRVVAAVKTQHAAGDETDPALYGNPTAT